MNIEELLNMPFLTLTPGFSKKYGSYSQKINFIHGKYSIPFNAMLVTIQPQCESKLEMHKELEMCVIISGLGLVEYQGQEYPVKTGDILYFHPFTTHKIINTGKQEITLLSAQWI